MGSPVSNEPDLEKGLSNARCDTDSTLLNANSQVAKTPSALTTCSRGPIQSVNSPSRVPKYRKLKQDEASYRTMATFLDSDENFMIYRRFGYLHARTLLRLQDKLRELEDDLDRYDDTDLEEGDESLKLLSSREADEADCKRIAKKDPQERTRTQILDEIEQVLVRYDDLLLKAQQMIALNTPAERDHQSVETYLYNTKPVVAAEWEFVYNKEDLVTLRDGREMAILDSITERLLKTLHCPMLHKLFASKRDREKSDDPEVFYYSKKRKNCLNTTILCFVLLSLLVLPIYVLYHLLRAHPDDKAYTISIGVMIIFMLLFSGVLSLFTRAKRHEIFTAAAGYCAVLMVFFSNIS